MISIKLICFVGAALLTGFSVAHAQDSAVFNSEQGAWLLYYQDPETEQWVIKTYPARTAIRPVIKSTVNWNGTQFSYHYKVKNERGAEQNISVIRIWGIPLTYPVPDLPSITADIKTDTTAWTHQKWAQMTVRNKWADQVLKAPRGWDAGLRVDEKVNQTSFVWTPGLKESDSNGVTPGHTQSGFAVFRPELPGIARTYLQGRITEPWGLDNLPDTPFWSRKVNEIQDQDFLLVPVLAPVIVVPQPYNGAELARRLKVHTQTWLKYGHINAEVLDRLNRQFDALIPALEGNNKVATRAAAIEMFKEVFGQHPGLNHHKLGEDDEDQAAEALPHKHAARSAAAPKLAAQPVALHRVAARALAFNLMYLLTRMEIGR